MYQYYLQDPQSSCHVWYVVCRALEQFRDQEGVYPGLKADDSQLSANLTFQHKHEEQVARVLEIAKGLVKEVSPD